MSEEVPLALAVADIVGKLGYVAGGASSHPSVGFKESKGLLGAHTKAFFIFKPLKWSDWRRYLLFDPPCIAKLDTTQKEWYVAVYGKEYEEEMGVLANVLHKQFGVNTWYKVVSDKPLNA